MPQLLKIKPSTGSVRSGSGPGSIAGSNMSDIERMERLMNLTKFAKKSIVKIFGKNFEDFRREMHYSKEIINSDLLSQSIPDSMIKHAEQVNIKDVVKDPFK